MKSLEPYAYAALRFMSGWMFAFHGAQKVLGIFAEGRQTMWTQIWVGGVIELVGGLCIALGIGTSYAAFLCSGMMAVAYFQFHWKMQMGANFLPAINQGEMAVLYCFIFLLIACRGGGKWTLTKD